jgi:G3E family GTPase
MSVDTFEASLHHAKPPEGWSHALQALWWDAHGEWDRAHSLVQIDEADPHCAWVHAYLHRTEGDLSNAAYWYRRSGHPVATGALAQERQLIANALLVLQPWFAVGARVRLRQ